MTPAADDATAQSRPSPRRASIDRESIELAEIGWPAPSELLDTIIRYEAVHAIADRDELRRRLEPSDRRIYALFHPATPGEPLVFVEVALTRGVPDSITTLLASDRTPIAAEVADTAVLYSINNGHTNLRGLSLGHHLITQATAALAAELPNLETFVTLSPAPGFGRWLRDRADAGDSAAAELLDLIALEGWTRDATSLERHAELTTALAATYLLEARSADGRTLDPVARFHLGNGATIERINPQGNLSPAGIAQSAGMMVNYRYDIGSRGC